jgi:hypothetical protein
MDSKRLKAYSITNFQTDCMAVVSMRTLTHQELLDLIDSAAEMDNQQSIGAVEGCSAKSRYS